MTTHPPPRRSAGPSRMGLAAAGLAAFGTFAVAILVAGPPLVPATGSAPVAAVTAAGSQPGGPVVDTVYVVTPAPAAALPAVHVLPSGENETDGTATESAGGDD